MHSKKGLLLVLATAFVFAGSFTGCVKQRSDTESQGENINALGDGSGSAKSEGSLNSWKTSMATKSAFKRSEFTLNTGSFLKPSKNSEAESLIVEPDVKIVKFYDVVDYSTSDPYLENTAELAEMLGEENKVYGIAYEITPDYFVINKLVKENEISTTEKTYSRFENGEWIVPIGSYNIQGFYNIEKVLNEDNRPTNKLVKIPVAKKDFLTAQKFLIDVNSFTKFARQEKIDVLPKSFFEGEWYFSETTVEARLDGGKIVGDLGSSDASFSSATRIIFNLQGTNLVGLNTNVDDEFKTGDENLLNYNTVIKIPIEQLDYRRLTTGPTIMKETTDDIKKLDKRTYVKLDFLKSETPQGVYASLLDSIFNQINNFKTLLDVTYGVDYLSFSVRDAESGSIKRYSFRKILKRDVIVARRAFVEDNRLFGTFTTVKNKKMDYKMNLKEDVEKNLLMARHNPHKDIVYYFTDQTPKDDWHRNIGREAVNIWNQGFARAGLGIHVVLNESKDIPLGDIRYNAMNIVKRAGAGLLGYGPSLIDSETGEIVSASMNMGMDNMLEQYYRAVRDYMGRKSGRYYNFRIESVNTTLPSIFNVFGKINSRLFYLDPITNQVALMSDVGVGVDKTHLDASVFTDTEKQFLREIGLAPNAAIQDVINKVQDMRLRSYQFANMGDIFGVIDSTMADGYTATKISDETIETNCPAVVELTKRMAKELVPTEEEVPLIEPCVKLFSQVDALTTVLHEMGHNLSMRHNFIASADKPNYPDLDRYTLKYMTVPRNMQQLKASSVMDYLTMEGQQIQLGDYDIATVRWIYAGEVETKGGQFKKIWDESLVPNKNIDPNAISQEVKIESLVSKADLKPYAYCTDEHRGLGIDPMCEAFDEGLNGKETTRYRIETTYDSLAKLYRYDRRGSSIISGVVLGNGLAMKENYDQWRFFLRTKTGFSRGYMQNMSMAEYQKTINELLTGPDAKVAREHLELRNMIVKFLVDIAFLSNKYCLVEDTDKEERLIELEKIRTELLGYGDYTVVSSCSSPSAAKYLVDKGLTLKKEFGHFLDQGNFDLDPSKVYDLPDFTGTASARAMALLVLTARLSPSLVNLKEGFTPSMLDEPDIRLYLQNLLLDRFVNGVRVSEDNTKVDYGAITADLFGKKELDELRARKAYKNFASEANLSSTYAVLVRLGLTLPGYPDDGRAMTMFVRTNPNEDQVVNKYANWIDYGSTYIFVHSKTSITGQMMTKYQQNQNLKQNSSVKPDDLIGAKVAITKAVANLLPKTEASTYMDVVNLVSWIGQNIQGLSSNPAGAPLAFLLQAGFDPEITIFSQFVQGYETANGAGSFEQLMKDATDPAADPVAKQKAQAILAQSTANDYAQLQANDPTIKIPTAANLQARLDGFLLKYNDQYKYYSKNADELDAQSDMIIKLFFQLANGL